MVYDVTGSLEALPSLIAGHFQWVMHLSRTFRSSPVRRRSSNRAQGNSTLAQVKLRSPVDQSE